MIAGQSLIVRDGIRAVSPFAVMVGIFMFFSGHNQPGGGFAAGLVFGAVVALRAIVGLPVPKDALRLMALGGVIVAGTAIAPMLVGDALLDQVIGERTLPVLGKVKVGTALVFELGVTIVVVGVVVALLRGLGAGTSLIEDPAIEHESGADQAGAERRGASDAAVGELDGVDGK